MKLPEKPVNPYIRHSAQTLTEPRKRDHERGGGLAATAGRPASMSARSAALTPRISAGRLRNHGQKKAHQSRPRPARMTKGIGQPWKTLKSHSPTSSGATKPPSRLKVQISPWAKPRRVVGTQSATTRARPATPPAYNGPKRQRSTNGSRDGTQPARR